MSNVQAAYLVFGLIFMAHYFATQRRVNIQIKSNPSRGEQAKFQKFVTINRIIVGVLILLGALWISFKDANQIEYCVLDCTAVEQSKIRADE